MTPARGPGIQGGGWQPPGCRARRRVSGFPAELGEHGTRTSLAALSQQALVSPSRDVPRVGFPHRFYFLPQGCKWTLTSTKRPSREGSKVQLGECSREHVGKKLSVRCFSLPFESLAGKKVSSSARCTIRGAEWDAYMIVARRPLESKLAVGDCPKQPLSAILCPYSQRRMFG